ncbi:hypothetical protein CP49_25530 [Bradyrhizobium valentinum]|uniref:Uncharacterized protein n=1 Tax=Bradyrhizobium valentinum TaxID=1518501 RepID=A0A0R3M189_9BRAD|nr:hypothetical protein CP49_25530 [Bradyrhizobium valentinum]
MSFSALWSKAISLVVSEVMSSGRALIWSGMGRTEPALAPRADASDSALFISESKTCRVGDLRAKGQPHPGDSP